MNINAGDNDIILEFLNWRKMQGFCESRTIKHRLKKLLEYLEEKNLEYSEVKSIDAQEYQGWLLEIEKKKGGHYEAGTVCNFVKIAISFFEFLRKTGKTSANPFIGIKKKRVRKKILTNLPTEKEMDELLRVVGRFDDVKSLRAQKVRYRLHVLCELLYSTGMRIGEAAALRCDEIDLKRGVIEFNDGKNGHERLVFLNDYAKETLKIYMNEMRELVLFKVWAAKGLLFGAEVAELSNLIRKMSGEISKKTNLPRVTSHKFRHAYGTHFLRRGCNIRHIQQLLGHKTIQSTEIYTKIDQGMLKNVFDECHPRKFEGRLQ